MSISNNNIQKFNMETLLQNLDSLRREHRLSQEKFGEIINSDQSTVSSILNGKRGAKIHVEQLASIALEFHVSVDDLMGIAPKEKESSEITLDEVFQRLFDIDEIANINITQIDVPYYVQEKNSNLVYKKETSVYALYFYDLNINNYLQEWNDLEECSLSDETKKTIIQIWEEDTLKKTKSLRKEWGFKDLQQQEKHLSELLIKHYNTITDYNQSDKRNRLVMKEPTVPPELLDTKNRKLLEDEKDSIMNGGILSKSDSKIFRAALTWLLSNTKSSDF